MQVMNHRGTEAQRGGCSKYQPLDAVSEDVGIEIEEQTPSDIAEFHVAQQLGLMDRQQSLDSFQLDDDASSNQKIQAKTGLKAMVFINERQVNLPLEGDVSESEFVCQTGFVDRLKQSRSHRAMDFHRATDDRAGQRVPAFVSGSIIHSSGYVRFRGSFSDEAPDSLCLCASVVPSSASVVKTRA